MTVAEYIKHLQKLPKDMVVFRWTSNHFGQPFWLEEPQPKSTKVVVDGGIKEFVAI